MFATPQHKANRFAFTKVEVSISRTAEKKWGIMVSVMIQGANTRPTSMAMNHQCSNLNLCMNFIGHAPLP